MLPGTDSPGVGYIPLLPIIPPVYANLTFDNILLSNPPATLAVTPESTFSATLNKRRVELYAL